MKCPHPGPQVRDPYKNILITIFLIYIIISLLIIQILITISTIAIIYIIAMITIYIIIVIICRLLSSCDTIHPPINDSLNVIEQSSMDVYTDYLTYCETELAIQAMRDSVR